ncbi:MAG: peptidase M16 [Candidatus Marinimicrobia bacterium]|nr:peptidase M16 [Candidatus Neomarinimicrobiota bacterium]|tara:strand:- start:3014 stop:5839 length:2826 start_codon:yes stop_codon:yes gene_type:complete
MKKKIISISLVYFLTGCSSDDSKTFTIDYEKYQLENGLTVILHQDDSDPLVAMATVVHVGSNREKPGRTGFAHFFEHVSFTASENTPPGAHRLLIPTWGGQRNGGTSYDYTFYYGVVPKDAMEKLAWVASDILGFVINTVDEETLEGEKQVVKNEKRQRVDNQPYGHSSGIIQKALYPKGHPYSWSVIGDLEDLQAATISDVKEFYNDFYGPSNTTVVIAGDIEIDDTKKMVERWFGEIKPSSNINEDPEPQLVTLENSKKLYHLDKFARLPELRIVFPTVENYHPDSYALNTLSDLLSDGKNSSFYKEIVEKQKLAPSTSAYNYSSEIAGQFAIIVRSNPNINLDDVYLAIQTALENFETDGISDKDLDRIKAGQETAFYNGISTNLNKSIQLGLYNEFAGDPGYIGEDINNILRVSKEDVQRVYDKYIKNKNAIYLSIVPQSQPDLVLSDSEEAYVSEEKIIQGTEKEFKMNYGESGSSFEKTPTVHDRSEPPLGELPLLEVPKVWRGKLSNGIQLYGIENNELPVVRFSMRIDGGQSLDAEDKAGTSLMLGAMLKEGTKSKTPAELEEAIDLLGSSISASADLEGLYVSGTSLAKNFDQTIKLVTEMLTEPRWDEQAFEIVINRRLTQIKERKTNAQSVAFNALAKQLYGNDHPASIPTGGTESSVESISMEDIKNYFEQNISPQVSHLHIAGNITQERAERSLQILSNKWNGNEVNIPEISKAEIPSKPKVFFIDIPDAKQSAISVGTLTIPGGSPELYKLTVVNNRLGGGMEARLMRTLRLEKGYTYGAGSFLRANTFQTPFYAYSQVRSNVTLESLEIFRDIMNGYADSYSNEDLETTKNKLIKGNALRFERLASLINMLGTMSKFGYPDRYIQKQQEVLTSIGLDEARSIARTNFNANRMYFVIAGDAKTQLNRIEKLGYGKPIILDREGNRID